MDQGFCLENTQNYTYEEFFDDIGYSEGVKNIQGPCFCFWGVGGGVEWSTCLQKVGGKPYEIRTGPSVYLNMTDVDDCMSRLFWQQLTFYYPGADAKDLNQGKSLNALNWILKSSSNVFDFCFIHIK